MKPEDLKIPFAWEDRRIMIKDRVWHIPERTVTASEFMFPGWESPVFFGNDHPVYVEYCSGNGAWIAAKAKANPMINWVAVEKKFARVKKIWSKIKNMELGNLIVICGEAMNATKRYFPDHSISAFYINFPDPWPKNRHAKHRLIQIDFVHELWRSLKTNCNFTFVSDDIPYSEWFIEAMHQHRGFVSQYPSPFYVNDCVDYGTSYFDELWRSKGRQIRYHQFCSVIRGN